MTTREEVIENSFPIVLPETHEYSPDRGTQSPCSSDFIANSPCNSTDLFRRRSCQVLAATEVLCKVEVDDYQILPQRESSIIVDLQTPMVIIPNENTKTDAVMGSSSNKESYYLQTVLHGEALESNSPTNTLFIELFKQPCGETSKEVQPVKTLSPSSEHLPRTVKQGIISNACSIGINEWMSTPASTNATIVFSSGPSSPDLLSLDQGCEKELATQVFNGAYKTALSLETDFNETYKTVFSLETDFNGIEPKSEPKEIIPFMDSLPSESDIQPPSVILRKPQQNSTNNTGEEDCKFNPDVIQHITVESRSTEVSEDCNQRQAIELSDVSCYERLLVATNASYGDETIENEGNQLAEELPEAEEQMSDSDDTANGSASRLNLNRDSLQEGLASPNKHSPAGAPNSRHREDVGSKENESINSISDDDTFVEETSSCGGGNSPSLSVNKFLLKERPKNRDVCSDENESVHSISDGEMSGEEIISRRSSAYPSLSINKLVLESRSKKPEVTPQGSSIKRQSRRGTLYTDAEENGMVKYIIENKAYMLIKGKSLWRDMESADVCPGRTWQSLKERFIKYTMKRIRKFATENQVKMFQTGLSSEKPRNRTANLPKSYSVMENKIIIEYLLKNRRYQFVGGNTIWRRMADKNIIPGRSWQSIKGHYRKVMVNNLGGLGLTEGQADALRSYCPESGQ